MDRGVAYFGAGIFPHEDVYLYAVDAASGEIVWRQDNVSAQDAGRNDLSPQGSMLISDDYLFVPSGRSLPACFDRRTGQLVFKRTHSWRTTAGGVIGGVHALLADDQIYASGPHHWLAMSQNKGDVGFGWFAGRQIVVQDDAAFLATGETIARLDRMQYAINSRRRHELEMLVYDSLKKMQAEKDKAVELRKTIDEAQSELKKIAMVGIVWQQAANGNGALLATGNRVYLGSQGEVRGFDRETGDPVWQVKVEGEATGLVAANGHLLVSTSSGAIYNFASSALAPAAIASDVSSKSESPYQRDEWSDAYAREAEAILAEYGSRRGFCLIVGNEQGRLAYELAMRSDLQIYAVEADAEKVRLGRERLRPTGLYGTRITIHQQIPIRWTTPIISPT